MIIIRVLTLLFALILTAPSTIFPIGHQTADHTIIDLTGVDNKQRIPETKNVIVLIHGTVAPLFSVLDPIKFLQGSTIGDESWYRKLVQATQKNDFYLNSSAMGMSEGFSHIPSSINYYEINNQISFKNALQPTVIAMHNFAHNHNLPNTEYKAFGWSGLLNEEARRVAGKQLLADLQAMYTPNTEFTLIAHSHGGSAALASALAAETEKPDFTIKTLLLLSTPMTPENAELVTHPFFNTIINCYSLGDIIQVSDIFSTRGPCKRQINETLAHEHLKNFCQQNNKRIYDVQLVSNGDPGAFWHNSMVYMAHHHNLIPSLFPLAPLVLAPVFLSLLQEAPANTYSHLDLAINSAPQNLHVQLFKHNSAEELAASENLFNQAKHLSSQAAAHWNPSKNIFKPISEIKQTILSFFGQTQEA
jgi:hypothetical protein